MAKDLFMTTRRPAVSTGYRIFRGLVRLWIRAAFRKVRVIDADSVPEGGPALWFAGHPGSFEEALVLVAAHNSQIHCMVERRLVRGALRKILAWGLSMILYDPAGDGWRQGVEAASNALGRSHALAIFAELQPVEASDSAGFARMAATIVTEAESHNANQLDVAVAPVHLLMPLAGTGSGETIVHFDRRIPPSTYMLEGKKPAERRQALSAALGAACEQNVFRLQPQDVQNFLSDLEQILRMDLEEEFITRPNWKQKAEGFDLSGFVVEWAGRLNVLDPGRLIALRGLLNAYHEGNRQAALEQLEAEAAGDWIKSSFRRGVAWTESFLGIPIVLYGALNHLVAGGILYAAGLLKKRSELGRGVLWALRAVSVLVPYALQIWLCEHFLDRAVAGTYAVTLPVTGLYLWRYSWLLRHRTRLLYLRAAAPRKAVALRKLRKGLVQELNAARDVYVESLELVH
jgi:hypothetical protein